MGRERRRRMTYEQAVIFSILVGVMALFIWGRWRHDIVAVIALSAAVLLGVVPYREAFLGLGHPATVTVAMVLTISRALTNSGAIDLIARHVTLSGKRLSLRLGGLSSLGAGLSMVMNNVGALALLMPVAIEAAQKAKRSPAVVLMPLSFGSILGGLVTLIGTPPNIIIASFRGKAVGEPFGMFDFTPVGAAVALAGLAFIAAVGWRLIPAERRRKLSQQELFDLEDYVSEARVTEDSPAAGKTVHDIEALVEDIDAAVVGVIRKGRPGLSMTRREPVQAGDLLIIEASPEAIGKFISKFGSAGSGDGEFNLPWGISLDKNDNIYIADWRNDRIQVFNADGQWQQSFGSSGDGIGEFSRPSGVGVDLCGGRGAIRRPRWAGRSRIPR